MILLNQLKIKAKRKDNDKWIKGFYIYDVITKSHLIFTKGIWIDVKIIKYNGIEEIKSKIRGLYEIDKNTICRFVDVINDEEIWENDIMEIGFKRYEIGGKESIEKWRGVVKMINNKWLYYNEKLQSFYMFGTVGFIKVGNIFDNPDLV